MTKVLVIEDNSTNLTLMTYLLDMFGYEALTASDGEKGLSLARSENPDIIICDLHMPHVDGWEFAQRIKSDPGMASIPLVAVTAFAMVGDRERVLASGFDGYIGKPIEPETFVASVAAFLPLAPPPPPRFIPEQSGVLPVPAPLPYSNGRKVLIVDDQAANRDLIRYILEGVGYFVTSAAGVTTGLAAARQASPDLIITDTHMSPHDGFDLINAVRLNPTLKSIPIILTSASGNYGETKTKAIATGAINFLGHPILADELLAMVEECLTRKGAV